MKHGPPSETGTAGKHGLEHRGRGLGLRYVFGPVYSRRLGLSLGVNNIPYKLCSYACAYCQVGPTLRLTLERRRYSDPDRVVAEVEQALRENPRIDYVSFVPDGEPTLDTALGEELRRIADLGARTAVITNSSLLWLDEVRRDLSNADYVSMKLDAVSIDTWRRLNRPAPGLSLEKIISAMKTFAAEHKGGIIVVTETMLVKGVNDSLSELEALAETLAEIDPDKAYISVPTRPPAEDWVKPPSPEKIVEAYNLFREKGLRVELLTTPEPPPGKLAGDNIVEAVYATLAVHPLPVEAIVEAARSRGEDPEKVVSQLLGKNDVVQVRYGGRVFLARRPLSARREGKR